METTNTKPFRFLDLPLELQQLVLTKHYEEQHHITIKPLENWEEHKRGYESTISINPLLVSHEFHQQVKDAIRMSRGFTLRMSSQPIGIPTFLRQAVTCIDIKDFDSRRVKMLKTGFPNLERVKIRAFGLHGTVGLEFRLLIESKTLFPVLQGKHDQEIGDKLQEAWDSASSIPKDPGFFGGVIVTTQCCVKIADPWLLEGCSCVVKGDILCFCVEFEGPLCRLTGKTIRRPREYGTWVIEGTDVFEQCSHGHLPA